MRATVFRYRRGERNSRIVIRTPVFFLGSFPSLYSRRPRCSRSRLRFRSIRDEAVRFPRSAGVPGTRRRENAAAQLRVRPRTRARAPARACECVARARVCVRVSDPRSSSARVRVCERDRVRAVPTTSSVQQVSRGDEGVGSSHWNSAPLHGTRGAHGAAGSVRLTGSHSQQDRHVRQIVIVHLVVATIAVKTTC